jgi:hypothetical protein
MALITLLMSVLYAWATAAGSDEGNEHSTRGMEDWKGT